ncbi:MAG: DEAD/DEAH box helicase [Flavobacteriaceae bacterium]|nr:DEAD/DEAH box helicase [Flavobacteriaceae bacterium]
MDHLNSEGPKIKKLSSQVLQHINQTISVSQKDIIRLDARIIQWINNQGWDGLRSIQRKAITPILKGDTDVIISAPTSGGKTEAFFLPACTAVAEQSKGYSILYISPLKALINDQFRRLEDLGALLNISVTPWHGDISPSIKMKSINNPQGILLVTPESLESLLINKSRLVKQSMSSLKYLCIDEFHAFIGTERGYHLLSLLERLEHLVNRVSQPVPRIALSATFGEDKDLISTILRPKGNFPYIIIEGERTDKVTYITLNGYVEYEDSPEDSYPLTNELFIECRGSANLIFPNTKGRVEEISAKLKDYCERLSVPNEFFPHHGSLSTELRVDLEKRLQNSSGPPTTAVCTTTLELGVDIGKVDTVYQVLSPPNRVSSLRQRYGRSGRREKGPVLKMLIQEKPYTADNTNIVDLLCPNIIQSLALIKLISCDGWIEPPDSSNKHFSTFVHQILAVLAQWGSIRIQQLYYLLCINGPFKKIEIDHFKELLVHLGRKKYIQQLESNELVLGIQGNAVVGHFNFYSVFSTPIEYRIISDKRQLGTIPIGFTIMEEQNIIFAGKYWKIISIDEEKRSILVKPLKGGKPPQFLGDGMLLHQRVAQEMYEIYRLGELPKITNPNFIFRISEKTMDLFKIGVKHFRRLKLNDERIIQNGENCVVFTWAGTKITDTLVILLRKEGFNASRISDFALEVSNTTRADLRSYLLYVLSNTGIPNETNLASIQNRKHLEKEKYDKLLPASLLFLSHGSRAFDSKGLKKCIDKILGIT